MRSLTKSFAARLAALEALDQQAEVQSIDGPPDVALMDDDEVLWQATLAIRHHALRVHPRSALGPIWLGLSHYKDSRWAAFYAAVSARATPLLEPMPKPIVFLAPWEIEHAIASIDAGVCSLSHSGYCNSRGVPVACNYRLGVRWDYLSDADGDERAALRDVQDTCDAVDWAQKLVNRQRYYPWERDFSKPEMTTLAEWRAWLAGVGEEHASTVRSIA